MKCVICDKDFEPKSKSNIVCSKECKKKRKAYTARLNYHDRKNGIYVKNNKNFAEYNESIYGEKFIEMYWDFDKNTLSPYDIQPFSHKEIYIKCQSKDYHGSYKVIASNFTKGSLCPYCNTFASGKVHYKDSVGYNHSHILDIWSSKNKKTPYDYSCGSYKDVWFKCENGVHEDYKQKIYNKIKLGCGCPRCRKSKGEKAIDDYLSRNNYKYEKEYKFDDLRGKRNQKLRFDFAILKNGIVKVLIEYDGEFHYNNHYKSRSDFSLMEQLNRDLEKTNYAKENKIKLIRIPYWDFDNIDKVLNKELEGVV